MPPLKPAATPVGFFAFRTPLLPFDELEAWSEGLQGPHALGDPARLDAALASDRAVLRARLRATFARPEVRDALFVASPSLSASAASWLETPDDERGLKAEPPLVRYFERMAARATPFGLFAGCSLGALGEATHLRVEERAVYQRHTRLDMDYLFALTEALTRDPGLRPSLVWRVNSSLYRAAGRLRFAVARVAGEGARTRAYHLVAVEPTDYLEATLARCEAGARLGALAEALVADEPGVTLDEAGAFLDALIDGQVIVPELAPAVTGPEPVHGLIDVLRATPEDGPSAVVAARLDAACAALDAIDRGGLGADPGRYRAVAEGLAGLPLKPELSRLFQVDMVKPAPDATLGREVVREILRAVELLHRTAAPRADALTRFRDAFVARWEEREVPLAEALDEESGVGFDPSSAPTAEASPLLDGLAFKESAPPEGARVSPRDAHLLRRLGAILRGGGRELVLDADDLTALARESPPPLPDSFAAVATVAADSDAALARGEFGIFLEGTAGPSGANLLARFCHADPALTERVARLLRAEEAHRPDAVYAEVVHLPEGRVGNVLLRPLLRDHEIPYLGRSGAARERQIPVDDLHVSVVGGRVRLRSARLGREVIPRLTNAHSFDRRGLGIYRFLGSLQHQGVANVGWSWGALDEAVFLPRVVAGRAVLSRARWLLTTAQIKTLTGAHGAALFRAARALRESLGMPRHVAVADADNALPVDFDNVLSLEAFTQIVKDRPMAPLVEMWPPPDALCARGPEGRFVHELVVPFVREPAEAPRSLAPLPAPRRAEAAARRSFPPGSEWLYAKVYCGTATADEVLREVVAPCVRDARASGAADAWFFLRYADPGWHVRARLHGSPGRLAGEVLPALHDAVAPLLADGRAQKLQIDTYEREVERYGGDEGMRLAERLFEVDSDAALAILETLSGDEGVDARWRLALCSVARLLEDLGLDAPARRAVVRRSRAAFGAEFRVDGEFEGQLGARYRKERGALAPLLTRGVSEDHPLAPGLDALAVRSVRLAPIASEIRLAEAQGRLTAPLFDLAASYAHMTANRLLRSAARAQELVIYDLLGRLMDAEIARART